MSVKLQAGTPVRFIQTKETGVIDSHSVFGVWAYIVYMDDGSYKYADDVDIEVWDKRNVFSEYIKGDLDVQTPIEDINCDTVHPFVTRMFDDVEGEIDERLTLEENNPNQSDVWVGSFDDLPQLVHQVAMCVSVESAIRMLPEYFPEAGPDELLLAADALYMTILYAFLAQQRLQDHFYPAEEIDSE